MRTYVRGRGRQRLKCRRTCRLVEYDLELCHSTRMRTRRPTSGSSSSIEASHSTTTISRQVRCWSSCIAPGLVRHKQSRFPWAVYHASEQWKLRSRWRRWPPNCTARRQMLLLLLRRWAATASAASAAAAAASRIADRQKDRQTEGRTVCNYSQRQPVRPPSSLDTDAPWVPLQAVALTVSWYFLTAPSILGMPLRVQN